MNRAYNKPERPDCCIYTPQWVAEELADKHLKHLRTGDPVVEPACGNGAFLKAIPDHLQAIGVEIDPTAAEEAKRFTGRKVMVGDFRTVKLPAAAAVIGNPPFATKLVESFLERAFELLPKGGFCGFILPAYSLQNGYRVSHWHQQWGMTQEMLPRQIFPSLAHPIVFATFIKGRTEIFQGFSLYREFASLATIDEPFKVLLHRSDSKSVWLAFVQELLIKLGGRATLEDIYRLASGANRPTGTQWWKEKIRQTLARYSFPKHQEEYSL